MKSALIHTLSWHGLKCRRQCVYKFGVVGKLVTPVDCKSAAPVHCWFKSNRLHQTTSRWTSGLGHHPFKVTRRVRFPYAIPICRGSSLGRAPDCLSDLGGFDSRPRRQLEGRLAEHRPPAQSQTTLECVP